MLPQMLLVFFLQLCPYHFIPPGLHIPVTTIYDTRYGEIEEKQSMKISMMLLFLKSSLVISLTTAVNVGKLNTISLVLPKKIPYYLQVS